MTATNTNLQEADAQDGLRHRTLLGVIFFDLMVFPYLMRSSGRRKRWPLPSATTRYFSSESFPNQLLRNRFQPRQVRRLVMEQQEKALMRRQRRRRRLKGVYKGQYYRIPLPSLAPVSTSMSLLPPVGVLPMLTQIPLTFSSPYCAYRPLSKAAMEKQSNSYYYYQLYAQHAKGWWKQYWSIVVLNLGAVCTLIGFTRSDTLELRGFAFLGNLSGLIYNIQQSYTSVLSTKISPMLVWTSLFATINCYKMMEIWDERKGYVRLSEEDEQVYSKFFMPHGVTPKQFQLLKTKADVRTVNKNDCLVQKGDPLNHVYLIVEGWTRANIKGRYLTAISFATDHHETKKGGASGAWVGEMGFLEAHWQQQQQIGEAVDSNGNDANKSMASEKQSNPVQEAQETSNSKGEKAVPSPLPNLKQQTHALFSIVAKEDCTVWQWSHDDMKELMAKSTDLRAALTRAMTAAVVGKVINFTVNTQQKNLPTWSTWLDDWKHSGGADDVVKVDRDAARDAASTSDAVHEIEHLPTHLLQRQELQQQQRAQSRAGPE